MKLKNIIYIIFFDQICDQELQPNRSSPAVFASSKAENTTIVVIHYHLCIKISSIHIYTHKQKLVSRKQRLLILNYRKHLSHHRDF